MGEYRAKGVNVYAIAYAIKSFYCFLFVVFTLRVLYIISPMWCICCYESRNEIKTTYFYFSLVCLIWTDVIRKRNPLRFSFLILLYSYIFWSVLLLFSSSFTIHLGTISCGAFRLMYSEHVALSKNCYFQTKGEHKKREVKLILYRVLIKCELYLK